METMRSTLFDLNDNLFSACGLGDDTPSNQVEGNPTMAQWFTPEWAASLLVSRTFPDLSPKSLVIEPTCGYGAFMKAIPEGVPVIGVEIDPELAEKARANTGRQVIAGDFTKVPLPDGVTAVIGNPPFDL